MGSVASRPQAPAPLPEAARVELEAYPRGATISIAGAVQYIYVNAQSSLATQLTHQQLFTSWQTATMTSL